MSDHMKRLLHEEDEEEQEFYYKSQQSQKRSWWNAPIWKIAGVLLALVVSNLFTASILVVKNSKTSAAEMDASAPAHYAKVEPFVELDTEYRQIHWNTEYSQKNRSASDPLWDAILPSHGFVAMDRKAIEEQGWPESMYLPSDQTKGVYLLEAYHHIHCLRILRKTFWEAVDGKPYTFHPNAHIDHCFDTLRQSVMCYADATPLYTFGDFTAGNGQTHKCKNWNQLRDWTTKNTACYVDGRDDDKLKDHFGACDDGNDHLVYGTGIPRD